MKLNQKLYYITDKEALETQDVEGHKVEIYYLNEFSQALVDFTSKGKFAVWSSVDGVNYRLFIEEGYYKTLKMLYSKRINSIWLGFWDKCEKLTKNFVRKITIPFSLLAMACVFILPQFLPKEAQTPVTITIMVVFVLMMIFVNRFTKKKVAQYNNESIDEIKKSLGTKNFDKLLNAQRDYIDEYFKIQQEQYDKEYNDSISKNEIEQNELDEVEIVEDNQKKDSDNIE